MLSAIVDPTIQYPEADSNYSPDERFPEYRFDNISLVSNPVYKAVRACFAQAGLDRDNLGSPRWNPLGKYISVRSRVFILANFVLHRSPGESTECFRAKCTHGSVLRALVDYALIATGEDGHVYFGNAPMQHCRWGEVLSETGAKTVSDFYHSVKAPAESCDLRLWLVERNKVGSVNRFERRDDHGGVHVELGADSLFSGLDGTGTPYRIMNYDTRRTESLHGNGSHIYVINREILESDVVISLPKLKTHEKVGITCALKSFVGAVGHKDSLPHYRFGPPSIGGDEYPVDKTGLFRLASTFHNWVQQSSPGGISGNSLRVMDYSARRLLKRWMRISEGAWYGNDTAWRMVLDLARVLTYATSSGELSPVPQRRHLSLVDGIVGGEGSGPLYPDPVHSGTLLFGDNPALTDYAAALLMGLSPARMPLISQSLQLVSYPLIDHPIEAEEVIYNGQSIPISKLAEAAHHNYRPPKGWKGRLSQ